MSQRWLSIVEYARTYSISDMTVRRRIKNGKLNAQLKDGKYYIPVEYENHAASHMNSSIGMVESEQPLKTVSGGVFD